jgi:DnaJ-class molecular chaperone
MKRKRERKCPDCSGGFNQPYYDGSTFGGYTVMCRSCGGTGVVQPKKRKKSLGADLSKVKIQEMSEEWKQAIQTLDKIGAEAKEYDQAQSIAEANRMWIEGSWD